MTRSRQAQRLLAMVLALLALPVLSQSMERAAGVVGILPLPEVFGEEACARYVPQDVAIFRAPAAASPMGRIYVAQPWTWHRDGGCAGLVVKVAMAGTAAHDAAHDAELPSLEFGYEQPGAIVLRRSGAWFEIALDKGAGWVRVGDAGRFLPVQRLLRDGLIYLRQGASIPLLPNPGARAVPRVAGHRTAADLAIKLLSLKDVDGTLWLQVESLDTDPCTQEKLMTVRFSGWLPFHDATARPAVWFRSRGC